MTNALLHSFAPVIDAQTEILVLGTMPGADSLRLGQYYAHPRNQFWPIVFATFENRRAPADYADKLSTLLSHRVGLWDSLQTCRRGGSLDSAITQETANDFPSLFARFPHVRTLLFNSQSSHRFFVRALGKPAHKYAVLPSTSPAHATLTFEQKFRLWRPALCGELP